MLPIIQLRSHLLLGIAPDTRPPPVEFAEMFATISHVIHTSKHVNAMDQRRLLGYVELASAMKRAQVFDFGEIPESRLMSEAVTGGALMGQNLLRLPYPSVLYWYTLTNLVHPGKEKWALDGPNPFAGTSRVRYATLVAEVSAEAKEAFSPDDRSALGTYWVADFLLLDPEMAAEARVQLQSEGASGTMEHELKRGRHMFLCSGVGYMQATEDCRWRGQLLDRPGVNLEDRQAQSLGSLADGVAAMTMILATKGVGLRREPAPAKLNAKREKAGKPAYPSITHVDARAYFDAMQRTALGGTHASPVPHLRRGHIRTYQDGRKTWVRSALVNCRSLEEAQVRDHYEVVA